ncbi:MAG: class I SAM-dependent methyltransferase [Acidiferrobacterales bacterium]|nr:class I SAM-dependent methyltransferase [Acidiferrobacterales bacterium]
MKLHKLSDGLKTTYRETNLARRVQLFDRWSAKALSEDIDTTSYDHCKTVEEYYDLCTEFMVYGWGESLHFAPLSPQESLADSKIRHQRLMIAKLELEEGMSVIDVGCGIGGPMRRVVREAGVRVTGINQSEVQLEKATSLSSKAQIDHMVDYVACSFMDMSGIEGGSFDRGYAIESTCHAPDKVKAFSEIYRVLKRGALFWGQEMCMTDKFDPDDNRHREIKRELMHGIALKEIATTTEVNQALEMAGFEIVEGNDRAVSTEDGPFTPWYKPMETRHGAIGNTLSRTKLGRKVFLGASRLAEAVGAFPKGSVQVIRLLDRTADAYVAGGQTGIFTPLYCFLARKPL